MASPPSPAGASVQVTEIDPARDPRWDAYVEARPDGLVYHHSRWLRVLEAEYGQRPLALACADPAGRLRGVLALMRTRGLPFVRRPEAGRRLSSLPRTPVAGPLADDDEAAAALLEAAVGRVREAPPTRLQIKAAGPWFDGLVDDLVGVPWRMSYVLELPDDPDKVRFGNSRNHARIRWAVKKAETSGVRVREAETLDEVREWYAIYLATMRHHIVPPRPFRLFEAMWNEMRPRGQMRLLLAEGTEGDARGQLAGSVVLALGATAFYAFNGRRPEGLTLRANDLLQWHAIHAAARAGHRFYDFGEVVEDHAGLADFKKKWGTEARRLHRYHFPAPASAGEPAPDESGPGRLTELAKSAWRRLPLRATALAGDRVYRYL